MCERMNASIWLVVFAFFALPAAGPIAAGKTIYVDDDAAGVSNGSSWENAYTFLQEALADANSAEKPVEIRAAQGIYRPDRGLVAIPEFDWRTTTFQLINGVTLKGGYAGLGESDPNARDIELYETILCADLNGDDVEVADPCDLLAEPSRSDNSYHVVTGSGTDETALLDGFTITGGNADIFPADCEGGGMFNHEGSPRLTDCTFSGNAANYIGGGMSNVFESSPILTNCTFLGNSANFGGGMHNIWDSSPSLTNCTFRQNSVDGYFAYGGGMANESNSNPTLTKCNFHGNSARNGGGIDNTRSTPMLTDCKFSENSADSGGGMANGPESNPILTNCTFSRNSAGNGGGMSNWEANPTLINCMFSGNSARTGGGMEVFEGHPTFINCIFSGNSARTGGGMEVFEGHPTAINCIFSGNSADEDGGGICSFLDSNATLTNCTFTGNKASLGGGICSLGANSTLANCTFSGNKGRYGGAICTISAEATVTESILWDNTSTEISGNASISYSDVQGAFPGEGNIDIDPLFANPGYWDPNGTPDDPNDDFWVDGDYHLKSEAGRYDPNTQTWVQDDVTSPCIDAGNPLNPIGYEPFPNGGIINMGAYGGTSEASKSYFGEPVCETIIAGDINGDCKVDFRDFAFMAYHWLENNGP